VAELSARALSGSGAEDAARRVEGVLRDLQRLDLNVVVLPQPDEVLLRSVEHARDAAIGAGRSAILAAATHDAAEIALRAFARSGFSGTWAATDMGASVVRAEDRVAAAAAFEAAATAAVAEDLLDPDTLEILRAPTDALRRITGLPQPGALSSFASPGGGSTDGLRVALGIAVGVVGVVAALAFGTIAFGLIVIACGLALIGQVGRRWMSR